MNDNRDSLIQQYLQGFRSLWNRPIALGSFLLLIGIVNPLWFSLTTETTLPPVLLLVFSPIATLFGARALVIGLYQRFPARPGILMARNIPVIIITIIAICVTVGGDNIGLLTFTIALAVGVSVGTLGALDMALRQHTSDQSTHNISPRDP